VDMVGHEAIGQDVEAKALGVFTKPVKIPETVDLGLEDRLVAAPPLDDMVGVADE